VGWTVVALMLALGAVTVYRLVRSWRIARARLDVPDPPDSGSA
jgi:hypothetical protein